MKFRVTIGDGIDLLVEADKEVEAVRKAKTVKDAMSFSDMDKNYFNKHKNKFDFIEKLRKSGATNMYGAAPYLQKEFKISLQEAEDILWFWMSNYDEITTSVGDSRIKDSLTIKKGDKLQIEARGKTFNKEVFSVEANYGTDEDPDWYLEFTDGTTMHQKTDGAKIVSVNGKAFKDGISGWVEKSGIKDSYAFGNTGWATNSNYSPDVLNGYLEQIRICLSLKDRKGAEKAKKDIVEYIADSRKYQSELKMNIEKVEQGFKHIESELSKLM